MLQELFRVPGLNLPVYSYGLMMVIGFLAAMELAKFLAKRAKINPELFVNAALIALVTGIVGARLSHVIENWRQYIDPTRSVAANFLDAINIRSGGLTYYGGFLLAFPTLVIYALKKKMPLRLSMDIVAPCLVIGLGFGRVGCFLNGCCYGDECKLPWAVQFPYQSFAYEEDVQLHRITPPRELLVPTADGDERLLTKDEIRSGEVNAHANGGLVVPVAANARALAVTQHSLPVHPAQLYSTFTAFLIAAIALCFITLHRTPGRAFALMLMLEGASRFVLEMLRVEPAVLGPMSLSMVIGLGLAVLGVALWIVFGLLDRPGRDQAISAA